MTAPGTWADPGADHARAPAASRARPGVVAASWASPGADDARPRALVVAAFPPAALAQAAVGPAAVLALAAMGGSVYSVTVSGAGDAQRTLDFTKLHDLRRFCGELRGQRFDRVVLDPGIFRIRAPGNLSQALVLPRQIYVLARLAWAGRAHVRLARGPQGRRALRWLGRLALATRPGRVVLDPGAGPLGAALARAFGAPPPGDLLTDLALTGPAALGLTRVARIAAAAQAVAAADPALAARLAAAAPAPGGDRAPTGGQARAEAVAFAPDPDWSATGVAVTRLMVHLRAATKLEPRLPRGGAEAARALARWYRRHIRLSGPGMVEPLGPRGPDDDAALIDGWWRALADGGWLAQPLARAPLPPGADVAALATALHARLAAPAPAAAAPLHAAACLAAPAAPTTPPPPLHAATATAAISHAPLHAAHARAPTASDPTAADPHPTDTHAAGAGARLDPAADPLWDGPAVPHADALSGFGLALALIARPRAALAAAGLPWRAGVLAPHLAGPRALTALPRARLGHPGGWAPDLTVIGLGQNDTGLGANLAMTVAALTLAGLAPVVRGSDMGLARVAPGGDAARPTGGAAAGMAGAAAPTTPAPRRLTRPVRLLHLNADLVPQTLMHPTLRLPRDAINIGFLLWEFAVLPQAHRLALDMLDEVWAPSRFVAQAYAAQGSAPVHLVKKAMIPGPVAPMDRAALGLTRDDVVFLVPFDFHSSVERKNPLAAVRAFRAAFPPDRRDVALVVKTTEVVRGHWGDPNGQWGAIADLAARDPRIRLLATRLSAPAYRGLIAACDCLITPHRAEGFGYAAAEALLLGRPVIATDYSGTTDFCDATTAFPVPYALVPATARETIFPLIGAEWAEIDHPALVETLRAVAADPAAAAARAQRGQARILADYSGPAQAARYLARLTALGLVAP